MLSNMRVSRKGAPHFQFKQLLAYAHDIGITGRSEKDITKTFTALKHSADIMRLKINAEKTKYMLVNGLNKTRKVRIT
jgi:hypothetical protein